MMLLKIYSTKFGHLKDTFRNIPIIIEDSKYLKFGYLTEIPLRKKNRCRIFLDDVTSVITSHNFFISMTVARPISNSEGV